MFNRSVCAALFLFCYGSLLLAQQPPARDGTAVSIVVQSLQAMGAPGNSFPVADSILTGQVMPIGAQGSPIALTIQTKGPDRVRFDQSVNGVAKTFVAVGNSGKRKAADGLLQLLPTTVARARSRIEHLPVLMLAGEFFRQDTALKYIGQEILYGRTVHHVLFQRVYARGAPSDAALQKDSGVEVFIDAQDLTVSEVRYNAPSEVDWRVSFPLRLQYRNYTDAQGLLVPTQITCFLNDQQVWILQVQNVAFNQGVPDATFDVR